MKTRGNRKNYTAMSDGTDFNGLDLENFASDNISSLIKQEDQSDANFSDSSSIIMIDSDSENNQPSTSTKTQKILTMKESKMMPKQLSDSSDSSDFTQHLKKKRQLKTVSSSSDEDTIQVIKRQKKKEKKRSTKITKKAEHMHTPKKMQKRKMDSESDETSTSEKPEANRQKLQHQRHKPDKLQKPIHTSSPSDTSSNSDSETSNSSQSTSDDQHKSMKKRSSKTNNSNSTNNAIKQLQMQLQALIDQQNKTTPKAKHHKRNDSNSKDESKKFRKNQHSSKQNNDDFINQLNDIQTFTCRKLKIGKSYKLLDINITDETGFNGSYKKATRKFEDKKRPTGYISVSLPKPVASLNDQMIQQMKTRITNNRHPHFIVNGIKSRERADGKGAYDVIDFKWM